MLSFRKLATAHDSGMKTQEDGVAFEAAASWRPHADVPGWTCKQGGLLGAVIFRQRARDKSKYIECLTLS